VQEELEILARNLKCYKSSIDGGDDENKTPAQASDQPKFKFNFDRNVHDPVNKKILAQAAHVACGDFHGESCEYCRGFFTSLAQLS